MSFFQCIFGPKLYMDYGETAQNIYKSSGMEKLGDQLISTMVFMYNVGYYTSPFIGTFLYRRGYFVSDYTYTLLKFGASVGLIVVISLCLRGAGRLQSRSYSNFIKSLCLSKNTNNSEEIRNYDFDFSEWTVDFDINLYIDKTDVEPKHYFYDGAKQTLPGFKISCRFLAYVSIHTFGIRMIYPGSVKILQKYMRPLLITGRAKLVKEFNGRRYKIKTRDRNDIDTIFIDNRKKYGNGKTLVICSEGNAGFYEIGIMITPLSKNYSVLGWNHPGFEGSTGKPFPDEEQNAIDCVMKFAIHQLGFTEENIILFGWSIGCYTTLWAASSYPNVKGVILDATFDDIIYLAQSRMPKSLAAVVKIAIRLYCNLNNTELISKFKGPIMIIRRTDDEIIAEDNCIETNRGNFLALHLLAYRYPNIFKPMQLKKAKTMLSQKIEIQNFSDSESLLYNLRLSNVESKLEKSVPIFIGEEFSEEERTQIAEFLVRKHVLDYASTHCTPLPAEYFYVPWDISKEINV